MNLWTAPFFTFFSRTFYAAIAGDRAKRGVLYLLYLSGLMTLVMLAVVQFLVLPAAETFAGWVKKEMPVLTVARDGVAIDRPTPYTMNHPDLGPFITFHTDLEEMTSEQMNGAQIGMTRNRLYVREAGQLRAYELKEYLAANPEIQKSADPVKIGPESIDRLAAFVRPAVFVVMGLGTLIGFFLWKLLIALLYTLPGMAFNRMRNSPLSFGKVFDLAIYAMTPAVAFQMLRLLVPVLAAIPFLFVLDISLTLAYLYFAVKMSELPGHTMQVSRD